MTTDERREQIKNILKKYKEPITGGELSKKFLVSRQVIVQDIAVLRAKGVNILATSSGYMIPVYDTDTKNIKTIICKHSGYDSMEEELKIIVDAGAKVLDVIVEHPVYGEIRSSLLITSRLDIDFFMKKVHGNEAAPLASLTGGEHIHTIEVPSEYAYEKIVEKLKMKHYLIKGE